MRLSRSANGLIQHKWLPGTDKGRGIDLADENSQFGSGCQNNDEAAMSNFYLGIGVMPCLKWMIAIAIFGSKTSSITGHDGAIENNTRANLRI